MSTTRRPGSASGSESGAVTDLSTLELPSRLGEEGKDATGAKLSRQGKLLDYDDEKVKGR